jgi:hypothetical protein
VNVTGIEWMPFIRFDRTRSTGPASSTSRIRDSRHVGDVVVEPGDLTRCEALADQ